MDPVRVAFSSLGLKLLTPWDEPRGILEVSHCSQSKGTGTETVIVRVGSHMRWSKGRQSRQ